MLPENKPISEAEGGVANATPKPSENTVTSQQPVTPVQPSVDVEALKAKYERDINQMKSTLQRQTSQVNKEWQDRYDDLQSQLHETAMKSMTTEERERYERQLEGEEIQTLQQKLAEIENERQMTNSTVNAFSFFIQQGVPADKLNLADGYDAVVSAGWGHLTSELAVLRQAAANPQPQKPVEPAPLKAAPGVVTDKGIPASGTTWAALRAQFGTDEAVYRAVEEGRLDPSIIPT